MSSNTKEAISANNKASLYGDFFVPAGSGIKFSKSFKHHGYAYYDLSVNIPDITVPCPTDMTDHAIKSSDTILVDGNVDIGVPEIKLNGNKTLRILGEGVLRIYVEGKCSLTKNAKMTIAANPSDAELRVEFYCNGDLTLENVLNETGVAANLKFYGTTKCKKIQIGGKNDFIGTVYAPSANFKWKGSGDYIGSLVADTIELRSSGDFHYDESLATASSPAPDGYKVTKWLEI